ncbi:hypothetical protein JWJ90_20915 [Desulfobulbus rhabdoformis]|uniref:hypothetical protein n=1 Tax=Desulfobulbus rhabdoformis TaxID=34032 RepID=UPI0019643A8A|nr:hypothetical protein [Desulfobulbus rhabdoformis]MBM9616729.1 hypothetical protein [Desulfobulbus rhabdoformis]
MDLLIAIDDTDSIEEGATGQLAQHIAKRIDQRGWGRCGAITRHQLLLAPEVPYTSHNSSMCFPASVHVPRSELIAFCSEILKACSAAGSDPGLCIVCPEELQDHEVLIGYGKATKQRVMTKEEAYQLAEDLGLHLSEHGGNGQGIIGALAGTGLRLSGNDGRFCGKCTIPSSHGITTVTQIHAAGIDRVQTLEGHHLGVAEPVFVGEWVKTVLLDNQSVLLVEPNARPERPSSDAPWKACERKIFMNY